MEFKFDLESAVVDLEQINDLLGIYDEFISEECPLKDARGHDATLAAQIYADRTHSFWCLIRAAQDKIISMRDEMQAAVEKYYEDKKKADKKKGGEAA